MFKVNVKVYGEEIFVGTGEQFDTVDDAKKFGMDMFKIWATVVEWEIRDNAEKLYHWSGVSHV